MKSHYSPARCAASLALCAAVLVLAGCGQKGPLYMPKVPPDPFVRTQPAQPAQAAPAAAAPADEKADGVTATPRDADSPKR
ncbi:hypothetical protein RB25_25100 [Herbaspirillum rubrisubalbicans]|uniref:Lipoprotein n=1 Tax=Herbaspirillum rubrisubalbicans TaxID=80842 RepID=A0ABX9BUV6_9BURK|nr:lipoprotein [Herbaspirillum rubrisubalbicans]MCP1575567.1 putative small lipoprotein YifL [Herbaspirillum rubrisubalbicans]RAM61526.1 hypothetical protein RB24_24545 [Herbaspirillum rubrisubalbicans]RAN42782.1 hypothetical protein RB25_25100 [Herbaspirillum rubrisubalbicans]